MRDFISGWKVSQSDALSIADFRVMHTNQVAFGSVECTNVTFSGVLFGAIGKVQTFSSPTCIGAGVCATIEVSAEKLPWNAEVITPEAGVTRLKLGLKGTGLNKEPTEPGFVALREHCAPLEASAVVFGEMSPKILNSGAELEFDQPGSGELGNAGLGPDRPAGLFKVEGLKVS